MAHAQIVQKIIDAVARARVGRRGVPEAAWSRTALNEWIKTPNDPRDSDQLAEA
jgi:hypothetical protein